MPALRVFTVRLTKQTRRSILDTSGLESPTFTPIPAPVWVSSREHTLTDSGKGAALGVGTLRSSTNCLCVAYGLGGLTLAFAADVHHPNIEVRQAASRQAPGFCCCCSGKTRPQRLAGLIRENPPPQLKDGTHNHQIRSKSLGR